MAGREAKYQLLRDEDNGSYSPQMRKPLYAQTRFLKFISQKKILLPLLSCLILSSIVNLYFYIEISHHRNGVSISPYANLEFDVETPIHWNSKFSDLSDEEELDRLWLDTIPWESGIMGMSKAEARALGLPESQPFPWDPEDTSIYIANGHHVLHCVRNLYISLREYRSGFPQSISHPHIIHCLDTLRTETMCFADDTPRYVPLNGQSKALKPGENQVRMCRNFERLDAWTKQHDGCYRYIEPGNDSISNLERFKFCKEDSKYLPRVREHFGYAADWIPEGLA